MADMYPKSIRVNLDIENLTGIQEFIGAAVADAWDDGYAQGSEDEHTGIVSPNPHRN